MYHRADCTMLDAKALDVFVFFLFARLLIMQINLPSGIATSSTTPSVVVWMADSGHFHGTESEGLLFPPWLACELLYPDPLS